MITARPVLTERRVRRRSCVSSLLLRGPRQEGPQWHDQTPQIPGFKDAFADGSDGVTAPDGTCVPRWVCNDPQRRAVMSEIITVGLNLGVQSRHLVDRIKDETFRLCEVMWWTALPPTRP